MNRPVRPAALVWLTACALYPGLTFTFQGIYPFWTGEFFNQVGQYGPWMDLAIKFGIPVAAISVLKAFVGVLWLAGVPGLWVGEWKAYPLVLGAAALSLLYPVGPAFMGATALVCLIVFREKAGTVPA